MPRDLRSNHPRRVVKAGSEATFSKLSFSALPPGVVQSGRLSLSWIAGGAIVTTLSIALLARFLQPEVAEAQRHFIVRFTLIATVLASAAVILAELRKMLPGIRLLEAGLVYEVLIAAAIAVLENAMPWQAGDVVRGSSSITIWLIAFALLVPLPPLPAVLFGLAGAAMGPLVHFLITPIMGLPPAEPNRLFIYYLPPFLTVVIAWLINMRMLRLEYAAAKAQDLGSYELERRLARGGMGEVWRARHKPLRREAAVKLIRPEMLMAHTGRNADMLLKRFEQEARAIASLRSPHTVSIYDFGMTEDGSLYYVMELLEGMDLEKLVQRFGPQPAARVVHILRQACASLEEAHRRSMVHRDIKPTNLFLCELGTSYDFCKLLDFGLVKVFQNPDSTLVTVDGHTAGTPAFIAPEIAMGRLEVDGRADLYGLGCVAYWLLSGSLVFEETNATAMAIAHVQQEPAPLARRTETPIPPDLESVIMRCLRKQPDQRPASAAELAYLLESCRGIPTWTERDAERWWEYNRAAIRSASQEEVPTHPSHDTQTLRSA